MRTRHDSPQLTAVRGRPTPRLLWEERKKWQSAARRASCQQMRRADRPKVRERGSFSVWKGALYHRDLQWFGTQTGQTVSDRTVNARVTNATHKTSYRARHAYIENFDDFEDRSMNHRHPCVGLTLRNDRLKIFRGRKNSVAPAWTAALHRKALRMEKISLHLNVRGGGGSTYFKWRAHSLMQETSKKGWNCNERGTD